MPDFERNPSLSAVIAATILKQLQGLRVCIPGRVEKYDSDTQRADVLPLFREDRKLQDGSTVSEAHPVLPNVPVMFPGGGGFRVTFPIRRGDTVMLIIADRSMELWKSSGGGPVDPVNPRAHDIADAIAIPQLNSFNEAWSSSSENMTIGNDEGPHITMTQSEIRIGGEKDETLIEPIPLGQKLVTYLTQLQTWAMTHAHVAPLGPTSPPSAPPPMVPPDLLSQIAKVK